MTHSAGYLTVFGIAVWLACAGRNEADGQSTTASDPLLGTWSLHTDPPPQGRLGTRLTLTLDSVMGDSVFGGVEFMFSGDVGIDPAIFGRLRGSRTDSTVALLVPPAETARLSLELRGTLRGDTIGLSSFRMGPDEMLGEAARLLLVRAPPAPTSREASATRHSP